MSSGHECTNLNFHILGFCAYIDPFRSSINLTFSRKFGPVNILTLRISKYHIIMKSFVHIESSRYHRQDHPNSIYMNIA